MIREFIDTDSTQLETFKSVAWPAADLEHWGKDTPDFSKHHKMLVAEIEGKIVGYGTLSTDCGVALIEDLLVHPDHQRRGIGRELVISLENAAKELGSHKMWLVTGTDWSARHLYEKLGYSIRATLPNHYGGKEFLYYDKNL